MNKFLLSLSLALSWYPLHAGQPVIQPHLHPIEAAVFDLGDVCITTHTLSALYEIGLLATTQLALDSYAAKNKSGLSFGDYFQSHVFYSFLESVQPRTDHHPVTKDGKGNVLPPIMIDWMTGKQTTREIRTKLLEILNTPDHPQYPTNAAQSAWLQGIIKLTFTPKKLANSRSLVTQAAQLAHDLNNHGIKLYILSNFDQKTFALLEKLPAFAPFFALFKDRIIISGAIGAVKPEEKPYQELCTLLKKDGIDPHQACFIDDRVENIEAGKKCGIHGILCPQKNGQPDIATVRNQCLQLGMLPAATETPFYNDAPTA